MASCTDSPRLYHPSYLRQCLAQYGIRPRKKWSQNFLITLASIEKVYKACALQKRQTPIFEVGPGFGALSQYFQEKGHPLCTIDIDPIMVQHLQHHALPALHADALTISWKDLFAQRQWEQPIHLISNLPFHSTAPLLERFFHHRHHFIGATFIMQDEVAQRLIGSTKQERSHITFLTWLFADVTLFEKLAPSHFYPAPAVHARIVTLRPKTAAPPNGVLTWSRHLFNHRRKKLATLLKGDGYHYPTQWLEHRIEDLRPTDILDLFLARKKITPF